jgi:hypothetical protein
MSEPVAVMSDHHVKIEDISSVGTASCSLSNFCGETDLSMFLGDIEVCVLLHI